MAVQTELFPKQAGGSRLFQLDIHGAFSDSLREAFNIKSHRRRMACVRDLMKNQVALIRRGSRHRDVGKDAVRYLTGMVDMLIRIMWDQLEIRSKPGDKQVALVAIGGYGRRELCPKSDIDMLILTSEKLSNSEKVLAETVVRNLWDCGLEAGPSVRSISQCRTALRKDLSTGTAFLGERFLAGNYTLYQKFLKLLETSSVMKSRSPLTRYILAERKNRTRRFGGLIQLLEPNLKEGNGCLRDVQMILWLARLKHGCRNLDDLVRKGLISPQDLENIRSGYGFLLQTRCFLHFHTGKKDDLLAFHLQPEIAADFGFLADGQQKPVEIFLQYFYRHTKAINQITETLISRWVQPVQRTGRTAGGKRHPLFHDNNGSLECKRQAGNPFRNNISLMLEYFDIANRTGLAYGNHALLRIKQAVQAVDLAEARPLEFTEALLALCKRPARVGRMLRAMHDVELLELIIPDFSRVRFHAQHNMYHIYTTDEHTLSVVRQLAYLQDGDREEITSIQEAFSRINDMDVLIVACFFHDLGKGQPGDHSKKGAAMVFHYMEKVGFSTGRCMEASQLVLHHLAMNEIAQKRNLDDPQTIRELIKKIKYPATLHKLYVLTYCDISSVHPDAWSDWKAALLRTLYHKTLDTMKKPIKASLPAKNLEDLVLKASSEDLSKSDILRHIHKMPEAYNSTTPPEDIPKHIIMARGLEDHKFILNLERHRIHYKLTIAVRDHPRLLMVMAAALAAVRLSILNAKIYTRKDGIALDEFNLVKPPSGKASLAGIQKSIEERLNRYVPLTSKKMSALRRDMESGRLSFKPKKSLGIPVGIEFSNSISKHYSTIDISCQDKIGLMYLVTTCFSELGINVHSAVLSTEAELAMDAFYITDQNNRKITDGNKIELIKKTLEEKLIALP
ncbi:[protein-PII] uridylyltransferase [Fibrobacterota bacterium]